MKVPFLDLRAQHLAIKREISAAIASVMDDSAFIGGRHVTSFEKAFSRMHGAKYAVGVGNGTDALAVALFAVGVRSGDEVITVANSFIATSEAISVLGARVVFADCDALSYTIDTSLIEENITANTKAIVPVHLYGQPADMDAVMRIAKKHGLRVIEDAAQAVLAEYRGKKVGSIGDMAAFSFYPGKNLGALGDGGAVVTNRERFSTTAGRYANHGRTSKYHHRIEGINSRLDGIQAAVLKVKMKYLRRWTMQRRMIAKSYRALLRDVGDVVLPHEMDYAKHVYHLYVIRTPDRDRLLRHMRKKGVETGIHYPTALPHLPAYRYLHHRSSDFPRATKFSREVLSLPIYPEMTEGQVGYVAKTVSDFFKGRRRSPRTVARVQQNHLFS